LILIISSLSVVISTYAGNYALYFDGENDVVKVGNVVTDYDLLEFWTLEAWIKPDGIQNRFQPNILGFPWRHPNLELCGNSSNSDCHNLLMPLTQLREISGKYFTIAAKNELDPKDEDGWYHIAGSWNNNTLTLLVNGEIQRQINPYDNGFKDNFKCQFPHCEEGLQIGGYRIKVENGFYNNQFFKGTIDEVRVWKVGRTQQQIQDTMGRVLYGTEPGLLYYWSFDEGWGSLVSSSSANAFGTLGGGLKIAEPKWVESDSPLTYNRNKTENPIIYQTIDNSHFILVGGLLSLGSFILGIIVCWFVINYMNSRKSSNNNTFNELVKDDGL